MVTVVLVTTDLYGANPCVAEYVGSRGVVVRCSLPLAIGTMALVRFGDPYEDEDVRHSDACTLEIAARIEAGPEQGWWVLIFGKPYPRK